mmetsp:Transcript_22684/g.31089  ORF Transcript_22684/g.31089 Transcript_22684/m.31089 type:complete len:204 (-) Transcript_22684:7-618(-)
MGNFPLTGILAEVGLALTIADTSWKSTNGLINRSKSGVTSPYEVTATEEAAPGCAARRASPTSLSNSQSAFGAQKLCKSSIPLLTFALSGDIESNARKAFFKGPIQPDFCAFLIMYSKISAPISDRSPIGILFIANFKSALLAIFGSTLLKRTRIIPKKDNFNVASLYLDTQGKFGQEDSSRSVGCAKRTFKAVALISLSFPD